MDYLSCLLKTSNPEAAAEIKSLFDEYEAASTKEAKFVREMIRQSRPLGRNCLWFTTLVSKLENLPPLYAEIERVGARNMRTLNMAQGQKISRVVAWSFYTVAEQQDWARNRWNKRG